ncbi:MAG: hypothetical protein M3019_11945 [Candidatus Dormibacteraeota bacterium]|nr:hypothetical protein [Candidatus Dormibacteraeota bacterium]
MPVLAFSALDALLVVILAAGGFVAVTLVCAAILAVLHLVLPSTDSGADEIDRLHPPEEGALPADPAPLDSGENA